MLSHAHRRRDDDGAVAVLAAVLFGTLFLVAAMVVQFGFTRDTQQDSQNAADASALAAAYAVVNNSPSPNFASSVSAAISYATKNFGTPASAWSTCTDSGRLAYVTTTTNCVSFDSSTAPTKVRVVIPVVETNTAVGAGAGVNSLAVSRLAEASVSAGVELNCGLCFLGPVDSGNADYTVTGGSIAVSGDVALGSNGNMTATGGTIGVSGTASGGGYTPGPPSKIASFNDPWASRSDLPPPTAGLAAKSNPCSSGSPGGQGKYAAFAFPNNTCTLKPGLYVITGAWTLSNNSVLAGTGVTLYFTCGTKSTPRVCIGPGEVGGYLGAKNGGASFSAPTASPTTRAVTNVAIVYDRYNTRDLGLQGNGGTSITGAVYAPSSKLEFNGNSCFGFSRGPVIVKGVIKANGNKSCVNITNPLGATYAALPGAINLSK